MWLLFVTLAISVTVVFLIRRVASVYTIWRKSGSVSRKENEATVENDEEIEWKEKMETAERYMLRHFKNPMFEGGNNILVCMEFIIHEPDKFVHQLFVDNCRKVLDALQKRHPLLQVGLEGPKSPDENSVDYYKDGWYFVKKKKFPKVPLTEVEDSWTNTCRKEMNTGWSLDGPFMRLTVCFDPSEEKYYLIYCWHHCICDASSCARLVRDFLGILNYFDHHDPHSEANKELALELSKAESRPLPKAVTKQVHVNHIKTTAGVVWFYTRLIARIFYSCGFQTCGFPLTKPLPYKRNSDFLQIRLRKDVTSSILSQCKERSLTVTNILHAVLVQNVVRVLFPHKKHSNKSIFIPIPVTVDLRRNKIVSSTDEDIRFLSSCIIPIFRIQYNLETDLWDLARQSHEQLKELIKEDVPVGYYQSLIYHSNFPQENRESYPLLFANLGMVEVVKGKQTTSILKHCSYSAQGVTNKVSVVTFTVDGVLIVDLSWNAAVKKDNIYKFAECVEDSFNNLAKTAANP
jgi:NRPS condensation-like uncharacterized protein